MSYQLLPTGTAGSPNVSVLTVQGSASGTALPVSLVGAATSANQTALNGVVGGQTDAAFTGGTATSTLSALLRGIYNSTVATTNAISSTSVVPPSPTFVATTSAGPSLALKTSAGSLYSANAVAGSTAGYLLLVDVASVPPSGTTVTPKQAIYLPPNASGGISFQLGLQQPFLNGVIALFSSSIYTYTPVSAAFIEGIVQ